MTKGPWTPFFSVYRWCSSSLCCIVQGGQVQRREVFIFSSDQKNSNAKCITVLINLLVAYNLFLEKILIAAYSRKFLSQIKENQRSKFSGFKVIKILIKIVRGSLLFYARHSKTPNNLYFSNFKPQKSGTGFLINYKADCNSFTSD